MPEQLHILIVPHTHWDREWYQTFQQFRMRLVKTVDTLLTILDQDEKFTHFMLDGQTIVLDDYIEVEPEQGGHLKQYTHTGRIQVGPWYVQPDEFLVSGESLIRNFQIGLQRATDFGNPMYVGYIPDSFGHIAQMPQILRGVGIDSAVFWRGVGAETQHSEFYWQAPDGSRVLVIHLADPVGYSNARQLPLSPPELVTRVEILTSNILAKATTDTLLFMNGSDHLEPQDGLPAALAAANILLAHIHPDHQHMFTKSDGQAQQTTTYDSITLRLGTLPEYIEYVRHYHTQHNHRFPLQTLRGEMRNSQYAHLLPSVLSSRMWIKQRNNEIEHLLERWVEPLTAWAAHIGAPYPKGLLRLAWQHLLQNHPHDSICGCSIDQVHRENSVRFAQAQQLGEGILSDAMQHLVDRIDTRAPFPTAYSGYEPVPIVIYNPAPGPRTSEIQVEVQLPGSLYNAVLIDAQGQRMPYRVTNRWRQELGSMPIARDMLATAVTLSSVTTPAQLIAMAHNMMLSMTGQAEDTHVISRVYVQDYSESPLHHEPRTPQPGIIYVEVMIAPKGRIIVNEQEIFTAGQHILNLLQREDIHTFEVSLVDQARETIEFIASDLPAYGLKTFWLYPRGLKDGTLPEGQSAASALIAQEHAIENEFYRVEARIEDGTLTIFDKKTGVVFPGLHRFIDGGDVGDLYNYCPPEHDILVHEPVEQPKIELVSTSPIQATLRISGRWAIPVSCAANRTERIARLTSCLIVSEVTLLPGVRRITIHTRVENKAKDHRLRVLFPVPYSVEHVAAEGTFEVCIRPVALPIPTTAAEWIEKPVNTFPQKRFVDISNGTIGLAVLNRGLPEYEVLRQSQGLAEGHTGVALTLLRCVEWLSRGDLPVRRGHAGPMEQTPEAQCLGTHEFDYALVPHAGTWETEGAFVLQEAQRFNTPIATRAIVTQEHEGQLPSCTSLLRVEPAELVVSTIKRSNKSSGLIVRIYNPLTRALQATIRPGLAFSHTAMTNLLEEPHEQVPIHEEEGQRSIHLRISGGSIITLLFT